MIRFVDLTHVYWPDPEEGGGPICAFLDVITGRFIANGDSQGAGEHTFSDMVDINYADYEDIERLVSLLPERFFEKS
jgi:hypothetical protein